MVYQPIHLGDVAYYEHARTLYEENLKSVYPTPPFSLTSLPETINNEP
jgi:hypothetical protein